MLHWVLLTSCNILLYMFSFHSLETTLFLWPRLWRSFFCRKCPKCRRKSLRSHQSLQRNQWRGERWMQVTCPRCYCIFFWGGGVIEVHQIFFVSGDVFDNSLHLLPCRCYKAEIPCVRSCSPADSDSHSSWCASVHPAHPALSTNWCHSKYFMSLQAAFTVYMLTLNLMMNSVKICRGCLSF